MHHSFPNRIMPHSFSLRISAIFLTLIAFFPDIRAKSLVDAQTDSLLKSHKMVYIDGRPSDSSTKAYIDSIRQRISVFYYDQFRHFSDPAAPYFLFLSKDAKLAMGVGGAVRMRAYYDWDAVIPAAGFAPYLIPSTPDPTQKRHFATTPSGTCLFFRVLGRIKTLGEYQLYIEADFTGYQSRDFKLKKAYAIINNFTVGYAPSTFSDPSALPPMIDAQGPANKITPTSVLVRYMPVIRDKWVLAVSAETPDPSIGADGTATKKVSNWLPDFAAFAQYQWDRGQHVRLSGIVRALSYRDVAAATNHNCIGWGLMLSSVAHPADRLTTYAIGTYGRGYASLGGDLLGNYDLVADPARPGYLYAPASVSYCLGLQYNFRPYLFSTVSMSQMRYLPGHQTSPDEYKYGWVACANLFWNMTPRIQVGAEYNIGRRGNFDRTHRYAQRAELMCMFSF